MFTRLLAAPSLTMMHRPLICTSVSMIQRAVVQLRADADLSEKKLGNGMRTIIPLHLLAVGGSEGRLAREVI